MASVFSIDQNCTTLWDVVPKVQALARAGYQVTQFVEDIDVAFTSLGARVEDEGLAIAREAYHHSGGSSWGAALYYMGFLGRLPVEVREWEAFTGLKTNTLAKQLGCSVDDLFDRYSPGDNWQLVGPSFAGDRYHHRVIGDLTVAEVGDRLRDVMRIGGENMLAAFPERSSQERLHEWLNHEEALLADLLDEYRDRALVDLYAAWLARYVPASVRVQMTSNLFGCGDRHQGTALLELFVRNYDRAAALYNQAVEHADTGQRGLRVKEGELPFFATVEHAGRLARTHVLLRGDELVFGERPVPVAADGGLPMAALRRAGVRSLSGKALVLVMQARLAPGGAPLALPHRGSMYMPGANRLMEALAAEGLLPGRLHPILRVRFRLLDRMRSLDTTLRLPDHLAAAFGTSEIPARQMAENYADLAAESLLRLESFRDPALREKWQHETQSDLTDAIEEKERRRRERARSGADRAETGRLWEETKELRRQLLQRTVDQIDRDFQVRDMDYWDSRGALWPWSLALGGREFYDELIASADISAEPVPEGWGVE